VTRAAIYTRVSSEMQLEGHSLDAQLDACRAFCRQRGYEVVGEYTDPAESASTTSRPQFQRMMADMRSGSFQVIVAHKLDRLSRNVTDVLLTMRELQQHSAMFVSVAEQFDFTSPIGRVILAVLAALAEWFLDNLRAEIGKGKHARAVKGLSNASLPPFGYARTDGGLVPDEHAPHVRWAFATYAAGQTSYRELAEELNRRGLVTRRGGRWNVDNVREMIQNPFYAGWIRERGVTTQITASGTRRRIPRGKGRLHQGAHEPIINQATWDACQAVRARRHREETRRIRRRTDEYLLGGIAFCAACGRKLRAGARKDGSYKNYMCTGRRMNCDCASTRRYITEAALIPQVDARMAALTIPGAIEARAVELANAPGDARASDAPDHTRRRRSLVAERDRLNAMYQKGNLEEARYDAETARVRAEIAEIDRQASATPDEVRATIERLHAMADLWAEATTVERAGILKAIYARVTVDLDAKEIVGWAARQEFAGML
jgi:site-specific DNA recombinase